MGALLRLAGPKSERNEYHEISQNDTCKRQRMSPCTFEESQRLIPNLPDELSIQIIARFPRICYFNIRLVSRKWKETVTSSELFKLRKEIGGFYKATTVRCVWRFDPIQNAWSGVTIMSASRAYCKTGILNNKLYVVGGVTRERGGLIPLQSAEVFEPSTGTWSEVPGMPFSRARALPTALLTDMEGYTGELYGARRLS
ncbi:unnamed protein product [Malus baccata var. baccata]